MKLECLEGRVVVSLKPTGKVILSTGQQYTTTKEVNDFTGDGKVLMTDDLGNKILLGGDADVPPTKWDSEYDESDCET